MKPLLYLSFLLLAASARAAPTEWLDGTVLADCRYCRTDAFAAERRKIANQAGPRHDPASGMGYVVTLDRNGPFVWGRAALVGTGDLIRTDAHVLFADTGELKAPDGRIYFQPMHHRGMNDLIEIDLTSVYRGGAVSPRQTDVKNDWAIARLRQDAIDKFDGDHVFAFLWDIRVTQDEIVEPDYMRASVLVLSPEAALAIHRSCRSVIDDHPSRYAFGVEEVFFIHCPSEYVQVGASGSALAIASPDGTWNLAGQVIGGGQSRLVRVGRSGRTGTTRTLGHQLFLGNVPTFRQTLNLIYLQELIRRGMDPRDR